MGKTIILWLKESLQLKKHYVFWKVLLACQAQMGAMCATSVFCGVVAGLASPGAQRDGATVCARPSCASAELLGEAQ